jgi:hypothetical protein
MRNFWNRRGSFDVEAELRRNRPEPPRELVEDITHEIRAARRKAPLRLVFAVALTVGMLVPLAAFGAVGYAASHASHVVNTLVGHSPPGQTPAESQYKGKKCGRGDGNPTNPQGKPYPPQAGPKKP